MTLTPLTVGTLDPVTNINLIFVGQSYTHPPSFGNVGPIMSDIVYDNTDFICK